MDREGVTTGGSDNVGTTGCFTTEPFSFCNVFSFASLLLRFLTGVLSGTPTGLTKPSLSLWFSLSLPGIGVDIMYGFFDAGFDVHAFEVVTDRAVMAVRAPRPPAICGVASFRGHSSVRRRDDVRFLVFQTILHGTEHVRGAGGGF